MFLTIHIWRKNYSKKCIPNKSMKHLYIITLIPTHYRIKNHRNSLQKAQWCLNQWLWFRKLWKGTAHNLMVIHCVVIHRFPTVCKALSSNPTTSKGAGYLWYNEVSSSLHFLSKYSSIYLLSAPEVVQGINNLASLKTSAT